MTAAKTTCPLCGSLATERFSLPHTTVRECSSIDCGLQFSHPQLTDEQLRLAYATLYYPENGNNSPVRFENTPDDTFRQVFCQLEARMGSLKDLKLLDYGCGRGALLKVSQEFGLKQFGIERDPHARKISERLPGAFIFQSIEELVGAGPQARFDLITLWTVIEHLQCPWGELARLRNLLRPGGRLLLSTMDIQCLRARIEGSHWENYQNPTHLYYFSRKSLTRAIRQAGFSGVHEWRLKIRHAHHGRLRRWAYGVSFSLGLSDGLYFLCRANDAPQDDAEAGTNSIVSDARPDSTEVSRVNPVRRMESRT